MPVIRLSCRRFLDVQVLRGEWAGYEGEVTAVAEETELIIKLAGVTNRSIQILQRADCGRVVKAQ